MIVYRLCKKDEIQIILNDKSFQNVGKFFEINKYMNTHLYQSDKKYIHFFKDKESIFHFDTVTDMYICTYDIPDNLLEAHYGIGFYLDKINFRDLEKVSEYAIENELINFNHLLKVEKILEYIDIKDYIFGDISPKLETIYLNNQIINELSNENCNKKLDHNQKKIILKRKNNGY